MEVGEAVLGEVAVFATTATEVDILLENVPKGAGRAVAEADFSVTHVKDLVILLGCARRGLEASDSLWLGISGVWV